MSSSSERLRAARARHFAQRPAVRGVATDDALDAAVDAALQSVGQGQTQSYSSLLSSFEHWQPESGDEQHQSLDSSSQPLDLIIGSLAGVSKPWRLGMNASQSTSASTAANGADEFALELAEQRAAMPTVSRAARAPQPMAREPQLARLLPDAACEFILVPDSTLVISCGGRQVLPAAMRPSLDGLEQFELVGNHDDDQDAVVAFCDNQSLDVQCSGANASGAEFGKARGPNEVCFQQSDDSGSEADNSIHASDEDDDCDFINVADLQLESAAFTRMTHEDADLNQNVDPDSVHSSAHSASADPFRVDDSGVALSVTLSDATTPTLTRILAAAGSAARDDDFEELDALFTSLLSREDLANLAVPPKFRDAQTRQRHSATTLAASVSPQTRPLPSATADPDDLSALVKRAFPRVEQDATLCSDREPLVAPTAASLDLARAESSCTAHEEALDGASRDALSDVSDMEFEELDATAPEMVAAGLGFLQADRPADMHLDNFFPDRADEAYSEPSYTPSFSAGGARPALARPK